MAGISTSVDIVDRVSGSLNRITAALYNTTSAFDRLDSASELSFNTSGIQAITEELYGYESKVLDIESELAETTARLEQMEAQTQKNTAAANKLSSMYSAVTSAISAIGVQRILDVSDGLVQTTSRLDMMNDGLQSTQELVNMVYASAQDARGSFSDMADVVARFGNNAADAFGSTAEVVDFANLLQKQMTIAGASTSEASNTMLQLSQALGSGTLRGDELNSIFEQAPNLIQNIADYLDVPIGQIRDMASEGQLSADVVKDAIFAASDEINEKFDEMPKTWGQIWQSMQNTALMKFQPVLQRLNDIANSDRFQSFVNGATNAMAMVANAAITVFDAVGEVGSFIADNWSMISPIVYGVVAALAMYATYLGVVNGMELISNGIKIASCIAAYAHAAATRTAVAATTAETAAQLGLNTAMLACPVTWIILAIAALIAAFYAIITAVNKVTGSTYSATGMIAGAFAFLAANVVNTFVVPVQNRIASFVNFFGNVFNDPVAAVQVLFYDLALTVIGYITSMASAIESVINKIPGVTVDITSGLDGFYSELEKAQQAVKDESGWIEYMGSMDYVDAESWANAGYDFGSGIADKVSSGIEGLTASLDPSSIDSAYTGTGAGSIADNLSNIAGDTSAIKDSVDISDENLKYLRDVAERDVINRFTTAEIKVDMQNNNTINNGMDIDGIVDQLTIGVQEAMEQAAEGVHS